MSFTCHFIRLLRGTFKAIDWAAETAFVGVLFGVCWIGSQHYRLRDWTEARHEACAKEDRK